MTAASAHLRGIVIAGALAALALALGFVTLAMNQSSSNAQPHIVLPLKARHKATSSRTTQSASKPAVKPKPKPDPNLAAALAAGLPRAVARALAATPVAVVQLTSATDSLAELAAAESLSGAQLAGVAYVSINVDKDGGPVEELTRVLGALPSVPATLVYQRPAKVFVTLTGFNDRTVVQQAAMNALPAVTTTASAAAAVGASWAARANELCTATLGRLTTLGNPKGTKAQVQRFETIAADFVGQFTALKPPAASKAQVASLNTALRRQYAFEYRALQAALKRDRVAFTANMKQSIAYAVQANAKVKQLGATACAEAGA